MKIKRTCLILLILYLLSGIGANAQTKEITPEFIKVNGVNVNNSKIAIKTEIKGHKVTIRTPKISKNKYLKLVNVAF